MNRIYIGANPSVMREKAFTYARKCLCRTGRDNCTCLSCKTDLKNHVDFLYMNKEKYLKEDIDEISSFAQRIPTYSKKNVVFVENLSGIATKMQNKILKDMEDNENFVLIGSAPANGNIIDTVLSRATVEISAPLSESAFLKQFPENGDLLFLASNGDKDVAEVMEKEVFSSFKTIKEKLESGSDPSFLLKILNLVKEKDKDSFYTKYENFVPNLFRFLFSLYLMPLKGNKMFSPNIEMTRLISVCDVLNEELSNSYKSTYSQNDFFSAICRFINTLGRKE